MSCAVWCYMILGYITISINAFYTAARVLGNWGIPIQWVTFLQNTGASPSTWVQVASTTLPETNIAPENRPSQKASRIPTIRFQVLLLMEEILHQLIWRNYHYLQGFIHLRWCRISSINRMVSFGECIPFSLEKFCVMPVAAEILRHQCDKVSDQTSPLPCSPFVTFSDVATGDIYVVVTSGIALGVSVLKIWMCGCMMVKCTDDWWNRALMIVESNLPPICLHISWMIAISRFQKQIDLVFFCSPYGAYVSNVIQSLGIGWFGFEATLRLGQWLLWCGTGGYILWTFFVVILWIGRCDATVGFWNRLGSMGDYG